LELFEDISILENLEIASDSATRRWVDDIVGPLHPGKPALRGAALAAVDEFNLADDLASLPRDIPYGRRRLVGIARSVALNPSVLLLDEPAAGLSDIESAELGRLLQRLATSWNMGILLVEHDIELVMNVCHRIVVMNFGAIIAEGPPSEIQTNEQVMNAYLGTPDDVVSVAPMADADTARPPLRSGS
jgi:sulfate-transporting ATPase